MKVALVYDRINKWGGAERVLLALHKMFPKAPLYTSVYDPPQAPWGAVFPKVYSSFLQKFPFAHSHHEWLASLMPLAFESFNFDEYDFVISVTSEAAKGIITKPKTLHVCYCLTPTRYLWSGYKDYFRDPTFRFLSKPLISYLRAWDKIAAQRPDVYIAISKEVQRRIKKYYGRESEVIYPPITLATSNWQLATRINNKTNSKPLVANPLVASGYFLVVSRLVPYKRVDIAIEAFNKLGWPLKIVGTGVEFGGLKRKAHKNIEFLGNLTDKELVQYYGDCSAFIVPGIEDFGLSILEVQQFGRPVIAFRGGGALENIVEGKTGEFFEPQTKEALIAKLKMFNPTKYKEEDCRKNARRFSEEVFVRRFKEVLRKYL